MFERNKSRDFLTAGRKRQLPKLEALEDRAVPAVVGALPSVGMAVITSAPGTASYQVNFAPTNTDTAQSGTLQQFNPALGTLNSVELIATGGTSTHAIMENMGTKPADFKEEVNADIRYNVAGTTLESTPSTTKTATLQAFDGVTGPTSSAFHDFGLINLSGTFQTTTLTAPADLAAFIDTTPTGTGTVDVAQEANVTTCSCGTGNLMSQVSTQASGNVKVVYNYTPATPTPSPDTGPPPGSPDSPNPLLPSKDLFIFYL
jgi:hypothetical protein